MYCTCINYYTIFIKLLCGWKSYVMVHVHVVWNLCNDLDFFYFLLWNARNSNLCIKHNDGCNLIWSVYEECHNHTQLYYVDEM